MNRQKWMLLVAGLALMAGAAALLWRLKAIQQLGKPGVKVIAVAGTQKLQVELPEWVAGCVSTNLEPNDVELSTLPKDTTITKRFYRGPKDFESLLSVVMMGTDRTSIHKPEFCVTSQGWSILKRETTSIHMERPHPYELPVRKFTLRKYIQTPSGQVVPASGLYVFWFVSEKRVTASHLSRVVAISWDLLTTGVLPRFAYVSCFSACAPGQEEAAFERVRQFLGKAVPQFQLAAPASAPPHVAAAGR